ncbi:hypothetical protein ACQWTT_001354 [Acinetobacter baumannii]
MAFDYIHVELLVGEHIHFGELSTELQTKGFDCEYKYYLVDRQGFLNLIDFDKENKKIYIPYNFTGEIEVYNENYFIIEFKNRKVIAITNSKTQEKILFP